MEKFEEKMNIDDFKNFLKDYDQKQIDDDVLYDCLCGINVLISGRDSNAIQMIIDSGLIKNLVTYLHFSNDKIILQNLGIFVRLLCGNNQQIDQVLSYGLLFSIKQLLTHQNHNVLLSVCVVLSSITRGSEKHIQKVINHNIFYEITKIAKSLKLKQFNIEIVNVFFNAINENDKQRHYLISIGIIEMLIEGFQNENLTFKYLGGLYDLILFEKDHDIKKSIILELRMRNVHDIVRNMLKVCNDPETLKFLNVIQNIK